MLRDTRLVTLAHLMTGLWRLAGVLLVSGFSRLLFRQGGPARHASRLVVRKGVCPCCESALFGTTVAYRHLCQLNLVGPDSPYLCPTCDRVKVGALQYRYRMECADE